MATERHNFASGINMKTLQKHGTGGNIIFTVLEVITTGTDKARMAQVTSKGNRQPGC